VAERTCIAVDLAKSVFEIAVSTRPGRVAERHRLSRAQLLRFIAQRPAAIVLFEACGSEHFWARDSERCGARAVLAAAPKMKQLDPVRRWALHLAARVGHNKATVALANKLAHYAWAVATRERDFAVQTIAT
jgi:transposase